MSHIAPAPLVDCRPVDEYRAGHIAGATSLPATELFQRMHELPQRHVPLALCGDTTSLAAARHFLLDREFTIASETLWSEALARSLAIDGILETGTTSRRLWQPSPLLQEFVQDILPRHDISGRQGLDIACGAGRDCVYLALNGWQMLGIDESAEALQRTLLLAKNNSATVQTLKVNLEKQANPFIGIIALQPGSIDLVTVSRYLHRPLLPLIQSLLSPNGFIVYQTFMQGCEKIGSPKNPRFLLEPGELARAFAGFDILRDDIFHLDDGRPLSAFIARKPG